MSQVIFILKNKKTLVTLAPRTLGTNVYLESSEQEGNGVVASTLANKGGSLSNNQGCLNAQHMP